MLAISGHRTVTWITTNVRHFGFGETSSRPTIGVIPAKAGNQILETNTAPGMGKQPTVYVLASKKNGTLYIGVTSNLIARVWQHRNHQIVGFTDKYCVVHLVHYEVYESMPEAITREKRLKKWHREWKIRLIEAENPDWTDLWDLIVQ